jgi:hypothetical protein
LVESELTREIKGSQRKPPQMPLCPSQILCSLAERYEGFKGISYIHFLYCWCRQQIPLKCWYISTKLYSVTSMKTLWFFIKASNVIPSVNIILSFQPLLLWMNVLNFTVFLPFSGPFLCPQHDIYRRDWLSVLQKGIRIGTWSNKKSEVRASNSDGWS